MIQVLSSLNYRELAIDFQKYLPLLTSVKTSHNFYCRSVARWPGGQGGGQLPPQRALKRGRLNDDGAHQPPSKLHEMCLIKMIIYVV